MDDDSLGSVGEEAAKLLHALNEWAKESGSEHVNAAASATEGLLGGLRSVNEHVATGAEECAYCPVCRAISFVRGTSPEVRAHLSSAASSMLQAAAGVLATGVPEEPRRSAPVEKIDLDPGD